MEGNEIRVIIERVEKKIIMSGKVYSAIIFHYWLLALAGYFIITGIIHEYMYTTIVFWIGMTVIFIFLIHKVWAKIARSLNIKNPQSSPLIFLSWLVGAIVGWFLIPLLLSHMNYVYPLTIAIGFLVFISLSVFGMFLSYHHLSNRWELEMLPGFIVPLAFLPVVSYISDPVMYYAGMVVVLSYGSTVFLYLIRAFKYLG